MHSLSEPRDVQSGTRQRLTRALEPISEGLRADGYDLRVGGEEAPFQLRIVASDEACPECLVPAEILELMLADAAEAGGVGDVAWTLDQRDEDRTVSRGE